MVKSTSDIWLCARAMGGLKLSNMCLSKWFQLLMQSGTKLMCVCVSHARSDMCVMLPAFCCQQRFVRYIKTWQNTASWSPAASNLDFTSPSAWTYTYACEARNRDVGDVLESRYWFGVCNATGTSCGVVAAFIQLACYGALVQELTTAPLKLICFGQPDSQVSVCCVPQAPGEAIEGKKQNKTANFVRLLWGVAFGTSVACSEYYGQNYGQISINFRSWWDLIFPLPACVTLSLQSSTAQNN